MALSCSYDEGAAHRAALGLILLKTDETLEDEAQGLLHEDGVVCRYVRISNHTQVTPETLAAMERDMPSAAALLPENANIKAIGYACTSASTIIGPRRIEEIIQSIHPGIPVTNPITAVMAALRELSVKKLGLLTPYTREVTSKMSDLLESEGFEIGSVGTFEQIDDWKVARITEESTFDAMVEMGSDPEIQAVFASCTNLRTFKVLAAAESVIGKPVISSNQALCWHLRKLAGLSSGDGPGRIFSV